LRALRTTDDTLLAKPCLTIMTGIGGNLSEDEERGGNATPRTMYESPADGGGDSIVRWVEGGLQESTSPVAESEKVVRDSTARPP
jgi:hypothetical protein